MPLALSPINIYLNPVQSLGRFAFTHLIRHYNLPVITLNLLTALYQSIIISFTTNGIATTLGTIRLIYTFINSNYLPTFSNLRYFIASRPGIVVMSIIDSLEPFWNISCNIVTKHVFSKLFRFFIVLIAFSIKISNNIKIF